MSWLSSSSLTSLKSQLSDLTRDVIQETDVDRSLLETECQLDRNRIAELESTEDRQKEEIQSLMRTNLNMQDRVDAAELQAATVSKEFRNIIVSLQEELNGVKLENRSLKDLFREQSYSVGRDGEGVKSEGEEGFRKQISDLERELERQGEEHRELIRSLEHSSQAVRRVNKLKGSKLLPNSHSQSHDERGRGDGVDYVNGESEGNSETQLVDTEEEHPLPQQVDNSVTAHGDEAKLSHSLEITLSKERAHKERLLRHLEDISAEHDKELISLVEENNSMKRELEVLRLKLSGLSAGFSEREFNSASTQTIPLRPIDTSDKPAGSLADNSFLQGGETGWLKDEVKNLTSKLRSSSLEVESLSRERETKQKVLQNLQLTVRQLERENDSLRAQSVNSWREELHVYSEQSERMSGEVKGLRSRCEELERELSQQLTASDVYSAVTAGGREMSGPHEYLEAELLRLKAELHRLVSEKNEMVNREQTRALLLQYITAPPASMDSAIQAISALLVLRPEEKETLKGSKKQKMNTQNSNPTIPHKSFSQLFIEFLMQESGPQPANSDSMGRHPVVLEPTPERGLSVPRDRDDRPSLATATLGPTPADISKVMSAPLPNSVQSVASKNKIVVN